MNLFRWMEISWLFGANFAFSLIHTRTYSRTQTHIPCQFFVCNTRLNTTDATPATTKINVRSYGNWTIIRRILLFYRCFQKKDWIKANRLDNKQNGSSIRHNFNRKPEQRVQSSLWIFYLCNIFVTKCIFPEYLYNFSCGISFKSTQRRKLREKSTESNFRWNIEWKTHSVILEMCIYWKYGA